MTLLDRLIPVPQLVEVHRVDVGTVPGRAWNAVRHGDLADTRAARALFRLRTLAERLVGGAPAELALRIDDLASSPGRPGFQRLAETPGEEVALGAIGKVWRLRIPFVHVADAASFARFDAPGYVKVAWAIRVRPLAAGARVEIEVRVAATDERSWRRFRRYFAVIGPGSRYVRRALLRRLSGRQPVFH